jgi:hypothetical protein
MGTKERGAYPSDVSDEEGASCLRCRLSSRHSSRYSIRSARVQILVFSPILDPTIHPLGKLPEITGIHMEFAVVLHNIDILSE